MDFYISKPVARKTLNNILEQVLKKEAASDEIQDFEEENELLELN
jgi:hypothetical protein